MLQAERKYQELLNGLSVKEQKFVSEYLVDGNGARSARVAGYSVGTARVIACQNLTKLNIKAATEAGLAAIVARCEIDADKVVRELATIGFSNLSHFLINDEGYVELEEGAPPEAIRAVASIKRKKKVINTDNGEITTCESELRLWDKVAALTLLGKRLRLWVERIETENPQDEAYRELLRQLKESKA